MVNQTIKKSSVEFNRHELETLETNKSNLNIETTNTALRIGQYALFFIDRFAPDVEQFRSDLKHSLKHEKLYLRRDVKRWLKI